MNTNNINQLSDIGMCDDFMKKLQSAILKLKCKHATLEKRIDVHLSIVKNSQEELLSRQVELQVLKNYHATAVEERKIMMYDYNISKVECRIKLMKLKLCDYNSVQLEWKKFRLQQIETALTDAELLLQKVTERRSDLAKASIPEVAVATIQPVLRPEQPLTIAKTPGLRQLRIIQQRYRCMKNQLFICHSSNRPSHCHIYILSATEELRSNVFSALLYSLLKYLLSELTNTICQRLLQYIYSF
ncbi:hypothetical protein [Niabella hibiscisoli]|uniref:hypothetical protein n=1 Tax=Niabella hibiscisoli TaxID=1825928 RepID=UPI001F0E7957|nr:hypothetical protein [Niabella hibiscisoli]MCH5719976.1 hypothetical protein [Niabella hibiscisoli]